MTFWKDVLQRFLSLCHAGQQNRLAPTEMMYIWDINVAVRGARASDVVSIWKLNFALLDALERSVVSLPGCLASETGQAQHTQATGPLGTDSDDVHLGNAFFSRSPEMHEARTTTLAHLAQDSIGWRPRPATRSP